MSREVQGHDEHLLGPRRGPCCRIVRWSGHGLSRPVPRAAPRDPAPLHRVPVLSTVSRGSGLYPADAMGAPVASDLPALLRICCVTGCGCKVASASAARYRWSVHKPRSRWRRHRRSDLLASIRQGSRDDPIRCLLRPRREQTRHRRLVTLGSQPDSRSPNLAPSLKPTSSP
jgi:hypothetical protein